MSDVKLHAVKSELVAPQAWIPFSATTLQNIQEPGIWVKGG